MAKQKEKTKSSSMKEAVPDLYNYKDIKRQKLLKKFNKSVKTIRRNIRCRSAYLRMITKYEQ